MQEEKQQEEKRELDLTKEQDTQQEAQEPKTSKEEEEKKPETAKQRQTKKNDFLPLWVDICAIICVAIAIFGLLAITGHPFTQKDADLKEIKAQNEELEAQNEELEAQNEQLEKELNTEKEEKQSLDSEVRDLYSFLEQNDCLLEVSQTIIDEKQVLFINVPLPDGMARSPYETNTKVPIFLKLPEDLDISDTDTLYVHFSNMDEEWTINTVEKWSDEISFFPYKNKNEQYFYWKISKNPAKYYVEFDPHNGETPYYLTLWWPGY